jgi:Predicted pPIWI-associating nuclease
MSDTFDFNLLGDAYTHLKDQGMALQKGGIELVRIADSGISNIAPVQTLVTTCLQLSKETPAVGPAINFLYESGRHSLTRVNEATAALKVAIPLLDTTLVSVSSAASGSNIAAGTLVEEVLSIVPTSRDVILAAWPPQGFARGFEEAELDAYLAKFDNDLARRRRGAWDAYHSASVDAVAQASHSMRDILAKIIAKEAANDKIQTCSWYKARKAEDITTKPSIRDRIRFLLYGPADKGLDQAELAGIERAVSPYVSDDGTLKKLAHGSTSFSREEAKLSMQKTEELLFLVLKRLYQTA